MEAISLPVYYTAHFLGLQFFLPFPLRFFTLGCFGA